MRSATGSPDRRALPRLHLVTDDAVLAVPGFARRAAAALRAGGPAVALHLRGPRSSGRSLHELADALARESERCGALVLVNDRVDVALAAGADGVQLGGRAMPVADARELLGPRHWVGASVHDREEATAAAAAGADFLLAGNVYETRSHPGRAGRGGAWPGTLATLGLPVVAIGGVTPARAAELRRSGAYGVAALGGVWEQDAAAAVAAYLRALEEA